MRSIQKLKVRHAVIAGILALFALHAPCSAAKAKPSRTIPSGAKIYVDSNEGFETFLLAALQAKRVLLRLVSSPDQADYILDSTLFHSHEFSATRSLAMTGRVSEAAVKLTSKSGDIIWAYAVTKGILSRGKQSVAEACAKHLKQIVQ